MSKRAESSESFLAGRDVFQWRLRAERAERERWDASVEYQWVQAKVIGDLEAERDALRGSLQEARRWIQALRDEVNSEGPGGIATMRRDIVARAEIFLSRTAPREGGE